MKMALLTEFLALPNRSNYYKIFAFVRGSVMVWYPRPIVLGHLFVVFWIEIFFDLIVFQVFFMLFVFSLKHLL